MEELKKAMNSLSQESWCVRQDLNRIPHYGITSRLLYFINSNKHAIILQELYQP
jgi:hypothetical protein